MVFRLIPTTAFMKSVVAQRGRIWRQCGTLKRSCDRTDAKRDFVAGDWLILVESEDGRDLRWVAERNLVPVQ